MPINRPQLIQALRGALEPLPAVLAMWEGGAAAFGRVDEWSDADVQLVVEDGHVDEAVAAAEGALEALGGIKTRLVLPAPTWHGHWQGFYRTHGASPFLMLDLVVMERSHPNKFLEPEIHGDKVIHFDKDDVLAAPPFDHAAWEERLRQRAEAIRGSFDLFQALTLKEIPRGNHIEALSFYQNFTLRPLVELLRLRHAPLHHHFHTRYLYYDLPPEIVERLHPLFFVASPDELPQKHAAAVAWAHELLEAEER